MDWHVDFRANMPAAGRGLYLDHAAVAPLSGPARSALAEWADDVSQSGDRHWSRWRMRIEEVRTLAASLLNAGDDEIALVGNTTQGIGLVAEGYPWQPGENVVVVTSDFPSNRLPWQNLRRKGVEVRTIAPARSGQLLAEELAAALDSKTRIAAVSWVDYASGWRLDLDEIAEVVHRRDALLFVDGIQGLGVHPLDVSRTPVDFLAADGHKWLLGPEGAGLLYIRKQHLDRLAPLGVGWNSMLTPSDFTTQEPSIRADAARYEGGSYNMAGFHALGASLELLTRYGVEQIETRLDGLTQVLCDGLQRYGARLHSDRSPKHCSAIVNCTIPGRSPIEIRRTALAGGLVVSCRGGGVRLSPHAWQTQVEMEEAAQILTGCEDWHSPH